MIEQQERNIANISGRRLVLIETFTKLITDSGGIVVTIKLKENDNCTTYASIAPVGQHR